MNISSGNIKSFQAQLSCIMNEASITANENSAFNISISIVDYFSKTVIPNINWKVLRFIFLQKTQI